jgi:hypothetical protein
VDARQRPDMTEAHHFFIVHDQDFGFVIHVHHLVSVVLT